MSLEPQQAARYGRQILLAEIGRVGQARICSATARLAGEGFAHIIAERYADRVGFAGTREGLIDVERLAPSEVLQEPAARLVLAASRAALAALRSTAIQDPR